MRSSARVLPRTLTVTFAALLLSLPATPRAVPAATMYRGFTIDEGRIRGSLELKGIRDATKEQIDIVWAVGLSQDTIAFLQTVPFILVPTSQIPNSSPGEYGGPTRAVLVSPLVLGFAHKPVLLHELMHAFHNQRLVNGFANRDIVTYYTAAKSIPAFARASHMMANVAEYFACAATTYLFGVTAQEPFQRSKIRDKQRDVFQYLEKMFGPTAGVYNGSLTSSP
jgi:hypothetical protein